MEINNITHRVCKRCLIEKPLEDFVKEKDMPLGRGRICKICKNKEYRDKRNNNWDYVRVQELVRERIRHNKDRRKRILKHAKDRAKLKNLEFNIILEDIDIPDICPILNIPLDGSDRNHTPSLDRIDNYKGYIKSNIKVISNKANFLKNSASLEDLLNICYYMVSNGIIMNEKCQWYMKKLIETEKKRG